MLYFTKINLKTYKGFIPKGADLVITEKGKELEKALTLYGFDEVDLFKSDFKNPIYGFIK